MYTFFSLDKEHKHLKMVKKPKQALKIKLNKEKNKTNTIDKETLSEKHFEERPKYCVQRLGVISI